MAADAASGDGPAPGGPEAGILEPPSSAVKRDTQQPGLIQRYREELQTRQWARRTVKTYPAEMGSPCAMARAEKTA